MAISGHDLKVKRVTANVKGKDLASAMGTEPYVISRIERRREVDLDTVGRYLAGLTVCDRKEAA